MFSRPPCSYREDWLRGYQPNITSYLRPEDLALLHENGRRASDEMPAGTYARKIYNRRLIDLSYNSSSLEGNTYSLLNTEKLVLEGIAADGKLDIELVMILNHREAICYLVYELNEIGPLADLYVWSYIRSCGRYGAVAESVGIDTLRVLHRQQRRALIARIVREQLHGEALEGVLADAITSLPPEQQNKFIEDTRYDLQHLSNVSIGGMGLTRAQLEQWLAGRE